MYACTKDTCKSNSSQIVIIMFIMLLACISQQFVPTQSAAQCPLSLFACANDTKPQFPTCCVRAAATQRVPVVAQLILLHSRITLLHCLTWQSVASAEQAVAAKHVCKSAHDQQSAEQNCCPASATHLQLSVSLHDWQAWILHTLSCSGWLRQFATLCGQLHHTSKM